MLHCESICLTLPHVLVLLHVSIVVIHGNTWSLYALPTSRLAFLVQLHHYLCSLTSAPDIYPVSGRFLFSTVSTMSNTTATLTSFASSQTSTLPFASHYYTDAPPLTAGCSSYNPLYKTSYSYNPSVAAGIIFTVLFTLSMIAHIGQSFWMRHYWLLVFAVGALTELIGWAARLWSAEW